MKKEPYLTASYKCIKCKGWFSYGLFSVKHIMCKNCVRVAKLEDEAHTSQNELKPHTGQPDAISS